KYINPFGTFSTEKWLEEKEARYISGVEIQATAFLNLLRGDWLRRWPARVEEGLIVALGLACGFGFVRFRPAIATVLALATLVMVMLFFHILFRRTLVWFPWLIVASEIGAAF